MSLSNIGMHTPYSAGQPEPGAAVCPVCGHRSAVRLGKWAGEYDRLRCASCGLIFADPLRGASGTYEQQYAERGAYQLYVETAKKVRSGKAALGWPYRVLLGRLATLKLQGTLFEVGCGVGYLPYYLGRKGWKVLGCDVDSSAIKCAKEVLNVDVMHSDFNRALVPDGSVDVLVAFEVIEHLEDPLAFLRLAAAKLRSGGYLFLSTPNSATPWPLRWKKQKEVLPPFHLTIFSERPLRRAAQRAGFEIAEFRQKPVPFRYELMEEGYTTPRLVLEAFKAFLTGVRGVTLFAALRNGKAGAPPDAQSTRRIVSHCS